MGLDESLAMMKTGWQGKDKELAVKAIEYLRKNGVLSTIEINEIRPPSNEIREFLMSWFDDIFCPMCLEELVTESAIEHIELWMLDGEADEEGEACGECDGCGGPLRMRKNGKVGYRCG